uniref:Translationally controlled tumor protein n=1 Tax=Panagrolaimus sp. ES5 TaxID=591445 RepID=A0AC34G678_9BILA
MDAEKLFYELYKELYDEFKAQDPGNENFDVVFEFDGK